MLTSYYPETLAYFSLRVITVFSLIMFKLTWQNSHIGMFPYIQTVALSHHKPSTKYVHDTGHSQGVPLRS